MKAMDNLRKPRYYNQVKLDMDYRDLSEIFGDFGD
jgi:hypothetical protein